MTPVPVAAPSKALMVLDRLDRGFKSHLRHGCISSFSCVALSCVGTGLVMADPPSKEFFQKCLKDNYELEQARRPNP
jgi:hypothetical protein